MRKCLLLVRKDLLTTRNAYSNSWYFLLFLFCFAFTPAMLPLLFIAITYLFVMALFQSEHSDRVCNIAAILPVRRRDMVIARYLYTWTVLVGGFVFACLINLAVQTARGAGSSWLSSALTGAAAGFLLTAVALPLIYRFGVVRIRVLVLVLYLAAFVVTVLPELPLWGAFPSAVPGLRGALFLLIACFLLSALSLFITLCQKQG